MSMVDMIDCPSVRSNCIYSLATADYQTQIRCGEAGEEDVTKFCSTFCKIRRCSSRSKAATLSVSSTAETMASRSQRWSIPAFKITLALLMHLTLANGITYVCLLPQTIRPGMDLSASVTLYRANGPVSLKLSVSSNATGSVVATTEMKDIAVGKNPVTKLLKIKLPIKLIESEYLITVSGSSNKALIFTNSTMVTVIQKTNLLFVQTDKAMYKPGQTVLFRVVAIYPTMKPCKDKMDIVIYDPDRNRIAQWLQKNDEKGVVGGELALSRQTPLGTWTIEVNTVVNSFTKTFEVSEYVLPKFEVSVAAPKYFTLFVEKPKQQPSLFITVTARYTYNQAVKGTVTLSGQDNRFSWRQDISFPLVKTAQLKNGVAQFEITPEELSLLVPKDSILSTDRDKPVWVALNYDRLIFSAKVNETVTGIVLSSNATVECRIVKYVLEFLDITPESFRRGLPYTGFVVLKQQDGGIPLLRDIQLPNGQFRDVTITLLPSWSSFGDQCTDKKKQELKAKLTASGLITFNFNINDRCEYSVKAFFKDESTGVNITGYKYIRPFLSENPVSIQVSLKKTDTVFKVGDVVPIEVRSSEIIKNLFYCVTSKVGIILAKTVSDVQTKTHQLKIRIDNDYAQKLVPHMRLVVWVVANNPKNPQTFEIISDSIQINTEGAFVNNVTLGFDSDKVQPGNNVTLEVKASGGSNVFVLAVDQSVLLLKGGNDITQDSVLDALSSYEDDTVVPTWRRSICRRCSWPNGEDSIEIFQNAKLICLTDGFIYQKMRRIWREFMMMKPMLEDGIAFDEKSDGNTVPESGAAVKVRTLFPETWIWDNRTTGSDGVATFKATAPDTITSWVASAFAVNSIHGLGIAPIPSTLTVFRPFFISLTLPYSIHRGEVFALKATVFNYLNESLTVKVTLKKSTFFNVQIGKEISKNKDVVKIVEVKKNDAASVSFLIDATRLGQMPIEVLAQGGSAGDGERRTVLVTPEGIEQHYSTSVLIDNSKQDKPSETKWNVVLPSKEKEFVPDSASVQITAIGDILGTTMNGVENLISMPYGCGEQQMLTTVPNLYILFYLRATGLLKEETEIKCKKYLLSGYQAELTFQRSDGSFSAFGNNDPSGSTWLSSYVMSVFIQARNIIPIEESKLAPTITWVIGNQNENGSFSEPPNGRIIHTDMQGGTSEGVPLTAFVLISLIKYQNNSALNESLIKDSISKAVQYLELQLNSLKDSYSLCIVSFALVLAHSSKASLALKKRDALAIKTNDQTHWEKREATTPVDSSKSFVPPFPEALAINVEMTAYALLTYAIQNDTKNCLPIARWLIAQRNPNGGFISTQDTVMGLHALAKFASLMFDKRSSFKLRITASNGKQDHTFDPITPNNMLTLQKWEPTEAIGPVVIKAKGLGIGLVQLNVKYNVYKLPSDRGLVLSVSPVVKDNGRGIILTICAKWTKEHQSIGMVLLVIQLPSGYNFDSIQEVGKSKGLFKKVETDPQSVSAYFDTLVKIETCVEVTLIRNVVVNNMKNSTVKLLEYYNPNNFVTTTYGLKLPPLPL